MAERSQRRSFLDEIDLKILDELHANARINLQTLARKLEISASTLHYRKNRLEEEKIIRGYHADVDLSEGDSAFNSCLLVSVDLASIHPFEAMLNSLPGIQYASQITGKINYILIIKTESYQHFLESIYNPMLNSGFVNQIETQNVVRNFLP